MRILVLIASDLYVRSFVTTGALDALGAQHQLIWTADQDLTNLDAVQRQAGFVGTLPSDPVREHAYDWIRGILMTAYRRRSRAMGIRVRHMPRWNWIKARLLALPGVRSVVIGLVLRRIGPNTDLRRLLETSSPDLVIAPFAGTGALIFDLVREGRALGIPSLLLVNGWDNLASKTTFTTLPDFIGVWGEQSVEHAVRIHGMERERVFPLGVPTFQSYFEFDRQNSTSPYPFRYVLFAGCAVPFDERTTLAVLDRVLTERGVDDVRVIYRPHPWRQPRAVDDAVREEDFRHVTIDAQVRDAYLAAAGRSDPVSPGEFLPALDYYPSLVGNAEFVVCPLSTMVVESAILDRRVLLLAYDDRVHDLPPSVIAEFDHFEGIDAINGFERVSSLDDLEQCFVAMLEAPPSASARAQILPWLFFDDATYGQRLADLVARLPLNN